MWDHTSLHKLIQSLTGPRFSSVSCSAFWMLCSQIPPSVYFHITSATGHSGVEEGPSPLISTDKACLGDQWLFFWLCIINQQTAHKNLPQTKQAILLLLRPPRLHTSDTKLWVFLLSTGNCVTAPARTGPEVRSQFVQIRATWGNGPGEMIVRDQIQLTMKIIAMMMMMVFPDGGYNQGSHFERVADAAKSSPRRKNKEEESYD